MTQPQRSARWGRAALRDRPGGDRLGDDRLGDDRGTVTAETAVLLPALVAVLALLLSGVAAGAAQIRCIDAARAAAREAARGESPARVAAAAAGSAPRGAMTLAREGDRVVVEVRQEVSLLGGPTVRVSGRAVALVEQP